MYQEKRPTCVTVIGWVWIVLGGFMCFSAAMGLLGILVADSMIEEDPSTPFLFKIYPLLALTQIGLATLGLISGIQFLKLKAWARSTLEGLTWLMLLFMVGLMAFWLYQWICMSSRHGSYGIGLMGAVMGIVITGIYGVPLGIMLKFLRGDKIRLAVAESAGLEREPPPPRPSS